MDKVFEAIKCHHCKRVLTNPILLPCGHSMCQIHADQAGEQVKCPKCGETHQNLRFVVNSELLAVIESQIGGIDLGPCHKEAKEACAKLEHILDQVDDMIKKPIYFSNKVIDGLINQVLVKSEQLKLEIDEKTEKLIAVLTEYQKSCQLNFEKPSFEKTLVNLKTTRKETEKLLKESLEFLNQLKVADERWKRIKKECDRKVHDLNQEFESVKKHLLMNELEKKTDQVEFFVDVDINHLFKWEMTKISSEILNFSQKKLLGRLFTISPQSKWKLLYRGSRDGYGAEDFHMKCDNKQKTLTIIETTNGHIFGGYTKRTWNGWDCVSGGYARDPNAFIFSLVNNVNFPFAVKIKKPRFAIFQSQSFGPTFGQSDIWIKDNSNTAENYSSVKSYFLPANYKNTPNILAGSEYFQVKEIEVFHLE